MADGNASRKRNSHRLAGHREQTILEPQQPRQHVPANSHNDETFTTSGYKMSNPPFHRLSSRYPAVHQRTCRYIYFIRFGIYRPQHTVHMFPSYKQGRLLKPFPSLFPSAHLYISFSLSTLSLRASWRKFPGRNIDGASCPARAPENDTRRRHYLPPPSLPPPPALRASYSCRLRGPATVKGGWGGGGALNSRFITVFSPIAGCFNLSFAPCLALHSCLLSPTRSRWRAFLFCFSSLPLFLHGAINYGIPRCRYDLHRNP